LLSFTDGVEKLQELHPDVEIYIAAIDSNPLSPDGMIIPGVGDAGDRLFGTPFVIAPNVLPDVMSPQKKQRT
jgi:uracil phosphoribosyltransferase